MIKGEAKKEYQREYMRKKRSNKKSVRPPVRPIVLDPIEDVRPPVKTPEDVRPRYELGKIGIPVRPTDKQKSEWAKFKRSQLT